MLGKLFKYEMKATARWLLPMYAGVILFSIINKIFMSVSFLGSNDRAETLPVLVQGVLNFASSISLTLYIVIIIATFVLTFAIMLQRFYKNLLGDEGYLMFTLPVKPSAHIFSKLFASTIWYLLSFVVTIASIAILLIQKIDFGMVWNFLSKIFVTLSTLTGINATLVLIELAVTLLVSLISSTLMFYAAIAMGHTRCNHRMLYSFGSYLLLNFITQILSFLLMLACTLPFQNNLVQFFSQEIPPEAYIHIMLISSIVLTTVLSVGYYVITNHILSKKLNLE